jgi:hypothetical protein
MDRGFGNFVLFRVQCSELDELQAKTGIFWGGKRVRWPGSFRSATGGAIQFAGRAPGVRFLLITTCCLEVRIDIIRPPVILPAPCSVLRCTAVHF